MARARKSAAETAEIVREYGPFAGGGIVRGVAYDGEAVWFAAGDHLQSFDPETGDTGETLAVPADAGTAFDGRHLFQIAGDEIQKVDPRTGRVLVTLPLSFEGPHAGLAWGEGALWVGSHLGHKIRKLDPETGKVLRTIESTRFVTGVAWAGDELWHGTWEGDESELRRVDAHSGDVLERLAMPAGTIITGLEFDGGGLFFCGGGKSGKVRAVRRPKRA
jgi:glutamine cyclotransferase